MLHSVTQLTLTSLSDIVGRPYVLHEGDLSKWSEDWKRQYVGRPLAVVRPGDVYQVSQVLAYCNTSGLKVVPQGGNTGMVAGALPDNSGKQIVLDMSRLNQIRKIEPANLAAHVDAGVTLHQIRVAAEATGLQFPMSMGSEGTCTVGGNIATNAGGTQVLRYGTMRDLTLGLECVFPDGSIWNGMRSLRKDNTGYNLRDLIIGSEGTLAVITGAVLKLYPGHAQHQVAWIRTASLDAAVELLSLARQECGDQLTAFEVMNAHSLSLVRRYLPDRNLPFILDDSEWAILLQLSFGAEDQASMVESLMEAALERGFVDADPILTTCAD
jgi:FAD/FMN-containing dehydrogenase